MLLLAGLLAVLLPARAGISRSAPLPLVSVISPPLLVSVPLDQAIEVRYRADSPAARLELWADGLLLFDKVASPEQETAHPWAPTELGPHRLTVCARAAEGAVLGCEERTIVGLPRGSLARVHLDGPEAAVSRRNLASAHSPWR